MTEMSLEIDSRLISCVVPKGRGAPLQKALADNKAIHNATLHHGRGVGKSLHGADRSMGDQQERDILEVIVEQEKCDEIFEYIFLKLKLMNHMVESYMSQKSPRILDLGYLTSLGKKNKLTKSKAVKL